eukprot:350848-Chlamydomonas_euryale.AAC.3
MVRRSHDTQATKRFKPAGIKEEHGERRAGGWKRGSGEEKTGVNEKGHFFSAPFFPQSSSSDNNSGSNKAKSTSIA